MSLDFLETLGLTQKESRLYEILLSEGELPISSLITKTKYKRATVYKSLYALEAKGIVTRKTVHKKLHFRPESPIVLSQLSTQRLQEIEDARTDLATLMPTLTQQYITSVEKPIVTTVQGVEGLKRIYEDTLKERQPIYAALTTADVDSELFNWVTKVYTKKRIAAKIPVQVIVSTGGWAQEYVKRNIEELRETRLVSAELFPFQHEVDIYGDKVAFIDFRKDGSLIGVIIHHPAIAKTMKALWDMAWRMSQEEIQIK